MFGLVLACLFVVGSLLVCARMEYGIYKTFREWDEKYDADSARDKAFQDMIGDMLDKGGSLYQPVDELLPEEPEDDEE